MGVSNPVNSSRSALTVMLLHQTTGIKRHLCCSLRWCAPRDAVKRSRSQGTTALEISEQSKMESSLFLLFTLSVSLSEFGSLVQTSHLFSYSDSGQMSRRMSRNNAGFDRSFRDELLPSESSVEGSGHSADSKSSQPLINKTVSYKEPDRLSNENHSGSGITLTTRSALTSHHSGARDQEADRANTSITRHTHSDILITSEEAFLESGHITTEKNLEPIANDDFPTGGNWPQHPRQIKVFTSTININPSGPGGPCVLGIRHCAVLQNLNGTSLLWDDMKRTLTFAWELHVFGSASLFTSMSVLAVLGLAGACTLPLPRPLCDALTLANSFLILGGSLRTVLLLIDPYGTCQILSHAFLAALHNVPLSLFLWTQVVLALITLRGFKLLLFPKTLQHPWVVGGLAISHSTTLFVADLYSSTLSPALPLLLQSLSICWGVPFCLGVFTKSLSHLRPFLRSSVPQWVPSQRTEKRGKRVTAVCAFLGLLCCSLQMYSLFWLYGLLGNWRRFGWGWWLVQFWARILEVAWGFSLLVLSSWIFWTPYRGNSRGDQGQGRSEVSKRPEEQCLWRRVLASIWKGPLSKSEKSWENLMPNNWAKYNLSKAGISNTMMCPYDDQLSTIMQEFKSDPGSCGTTDSQAALLWQKVGERECVLSLIEFDMRPPSPINLRGSIDNALIKGGLFTPPPPSWTQVTDTIDRKGGPSMIPPAYVGYRWMLDTESISPSLDHFQAKDTQVQSPTITAHYNGGIGSPFSPYPDEEIPPAAHQNDWSDDDVTDL